MSLASTIGVKALRAAQAALETIGHNVANANTPGYSRQRVDLSAAHPLLSRGHTVGSGVDATAIVRAADDIVVRRIAQQKGVLGMLAARVDGLGELESLFGEPGDTGLAALFDDMFSKGSSLAADPTDPALRSGFVRSGSDLAARFHELSEGVRDLREDAASRIFASIDRANQLAKEIVGLNVRIAEAEVGNEHANDLRDKRDVALAALGELVDVRTVEDTQSRVSVTVGGRMLVGPAQTFALGSSVDAKGAVSITIAGEEATNAVRGGAIGGWLRIANESASGALAQIDTLAKALIFEANHAHGTGVPSSGPFSRLDSTYALRDSDGSPARPEQLLSEANLPFDFGSGELWVHVTDEATGAVRATKIAIDEERTTVGDFIDAIDSIAHLDAALDPTGRISIGAETGFRFDFARRLATSPDVEGTFGGAYAAIASGGTQPFQIANGDTLTIDGFASTFTVAFSNSDFENPARATAAEIAAVLNADSSFAANGLRAVDVGGALAIRTEIGGASESFTIAGGSVLAELGWSSGQVVSGADQDVDVVVSGEYSGAANSRYTFRPTMNGVIGTTVGLSIDVFDDVGTRVKTLDVGAGYTPGSALELGDGVRVSFGLGSLSASEHDVFALDLVADSDTSGLVAALGFNALFTGTGADDIAVRQDIAADPSKLSISGGGADGDASALEAFVALKQKGVGSLGGASITSAYGNLVSDVGFEAASASNAQDTETFLMESLQQRRDAVSGVDVDEELVDMVAFEQAYAAAARYLQVVNQLQDELMRIL